MYNQLWEWMNAVNGTVFMGTQVNLIFEKKTQLITHVGWVWVKLGPSQIIRVFMCHHDL